MSLLLLLDSGGAGLTIDSVSDSVVPRRGGLVVEIVGEGFESTAIVTLCQAAVEKGRGYIFDADFDVTSTSIFVGLPALPDGTYDLKVTVGASTATLNSAFEYRLFAEETKVLRARGSFAGVWRVGPRILLNNTSGLSL